MAFVALAVPAFLGGLVTGLIRPPIPLRRGKRDQKQFSLWPELANVQSLPIFIWQCRCALSFALQIAAA